MVNVFKFHTHEMIVDVIVLATFQISSTFVNRQQMNFLVDFVLVLYSVLICFPRELINALSEEMIDPNR